MSDISQFTGKKVVTCPQTQEMHDRMEKILYDYAGDLTISTAVGVLEVLKFELLTTETE